VTRTSKTTKIKKGDIIYYENRTQGTLKH